MVTLSETSPKLIPPTPLIKRKGVVIRIVIGAVLLIMIGVFFLLFTRVWDPLWNPFRPSPQETFSRMLTNMDNLSSFSFEVNLENTAEEIKDKLVMTLRGDLDILNARRPRSDVEFDFSAGNYPETGFNVAGAHRVTRNTPYFKLTKLQLPTNLDYLRSFGVKIERIKDQWFRFDKKEFKNMMLMLSGEIVEEQTQEEELEERSKQPPKRVFIKKLINFLRKENVLKLRLLRMKVLLKMRV